MTTIVQAPCGFAVPLRARPDVGRQLRGLIPIDHTSIWPSLIDPHTEERALAWLTLQRLKHIDPERFNHVVLRTHRNRMPHKNVRTAGF